MAEGIKLNPSQDESRGFDKKTGLGLVLIFSVFILILSIFDYIVIKIEGCTLSIFLF